MDDPPIKHSFFTSPNSYSILSNIKRNKKEIIDNTIKIPPLFIINISQFSQLRLEISKIIKNSFTVTAKYDKIKVNVKSIEDFRAITKFLDGKRYECYIYRLKNERDITTIGKNLPISITEFEVMKKLKQLKFPVKSVIRLTNKDKASTPFIAVQLINHPISHDIFKFNKLLNSIIITEPR